MSGTRSAVTRLRRQTPALVRLMTVLHRKASVDRRSVRSVRFFADKNAERIEAEAEWQVSSSEQLEGKGMPWRGFASAKSNASSSPLFRLDSKTAAHNAHEWDHSNLQPGLLAYRKADPAPRRKVAGSRSGVLARFLVELIDLPRASFAQ